MSQRYAYHPTREELLAVLTDSGEMQEYYDSLGDLCDEASESEFARCLGYESIDS